MEIKKKGERRTEEIQSHTLYMRLALHCLHNKKLINSIKIPTRKEGRKLPFLYISY